VFIDECISVIDQGITQLSQSIGNERFTQKQKKKKQGHCAKYKTSLLRWTRSITFSIKSLLLPQKPTRKKGVG
jgi:hypothetical protein